MGCFEISVDFSANLRHLGNYTLHVQSPFTASYSFEVGSLSDERIIFLVSGWNASPCFFISCLFAFFPLCFGLQIKEFRKPEFEVSSSIVSDPSQHLCGNKATLRVSAAYYAGGPLPDTPIKYSVNWSCMYGVSRSSPYSFLLFPTVPLFCFSLPHFQPLPSVIQDLVGTHSEKKKKYVPWYYSFFPGADKLQSFLL